MRLVGVLQNETDVRRLAVFLEKKGIETHCDAAFEAQTGAMSYQIWVLDEDRIDEAAREFQAFLENPLAPAYALPMAEIEPEKPLAQETLETTEKAKPATVFFTRFVILFCAFVFFLNLMQEYAISKNTKIQNVWIITPIASSFLFDLPEPLEKWVELLHQKEVLPSALQEESLALQAAPFWKGAYDWALLKIQHQNTQAAEGPLFGSIAKGEVWRLFSPAVLHTDFLHILFNMLWVWVLSRPIEQRIGPFRLALFSLTVGILCNVLQYLMTGPLFLGYSGVVMGLAGFTWMREKIAPWEGYPLSRSTFLFLLIFVGGIFALQVISFILQVFMQIAFAPNIANTAHIAGALCGALLARLPFFAARTSR